MSTPLPYGDLLERKVKARIPTLAGEFQLYLYAGSGDAKEHVAMVMGDVGEKTDVLVRIHSECFTGEVLGSSRCDCAEQLGQALQKIAGEGCGVLIYLRQEGRGIGLAEKLRAYNLQDQGYDTVDANLLLGHQADGRDYTVAALILRDLGIRSVRLLTNNPQKIESLGRLGIPVSGRLPLLPTVNEHNAKYLFTKASRMNHILKLKAIMHADGYPTAPALARMDDPAKAGHMPPNVRASLYFTGQRQVSVREESIPDAGPGEVLVETLLSAISPGTESLIYRGEFPEGMSVDDSIADLQGSFAYPLKYGYATVGRVVETGNGVDPGWKHRLVLAFHPHESHFTAAPETLMPLPDDVRPEDAVFLPNMETAVNFAMDGSPLIGEKVAVFGQGIVGLLTTSLLARFPVGDLITFDKYPLRRQASTDAGAHICLDPGSPGANDRMRERLPGGADLTYEITGSPTALDLALHATGYAGRVVIGSWYGSKHANVDLGGRFHRSRIRLISSQVSTVAPELLGRWTKSRRFDVAWEMIRQLKPSRFVTQRFPISKADEAYRLLDQNPGEAIQVFLTY